MTNTFVYLTDVRGCLSMLFFLCAVCFPLVWSQSSVDCFGLYFDCGSGSGSEKISTASSYSTSASSSTVLSNTNTSILAPSVTYFTTRLEYGSKSISLSIPSYSTFRLTLSPTIAGAFLTSASPDILPSSTTTLIQTNSDESLTPYLFIWSPVLGTVLVVACILCFCCCCIIFIIRRRRISREYTLKVDGLLKEEKGLQFSKRLSIQVETNSQKWRTPSTSSVTQTSFNAPPVVSVTIKEEITLEDTNVEGNIDENVIHTTNKDKAINEVATEAKTEPLEVKPMCLSPEIFINNNVAELTNACSQKLAHEDSKKGDDMEDKPPNVSLMSDDLSLDTTSDVPTSASNFVAEINALFDTDTAPTKEDIKDNIPTTIGKNIDKI